MNFESFHIDLNHVSHAHVHGAGPKFICVHVIFHVESARAGTGWGNPKID